MSTENGETTVSSVTINALGYRARCTETGCRNLGRMILRYADAGGRPTSHPVLCHAHSRVMLARDRAAGLKVYDDREVRAQPAISNALSPAPALPSDLGRASCVGAARETQSSAFIIRSDAAGGSESRV
jgi:hypothetical protein